MAAFRRILYELEVLSDETWFLSELSPAIVIPLSLGEQLASMWSQIDQSTVLNLFGKDVEYFQPRVFYSPLVLATIERELGLNGRDVLNVFDGTFNLYETAVLLKLAESDDLTAIVSPKAQEFVKKIQSEMTLTIRTEVRPEQTSPLVTNAFIANAVFGLLNLEDQAAMRFVANRFVNLRTDDQFEHSVAAFTKILVFFQVKGHPDAQKFMLKHGRVFESLQTHLYGIVLECEKYTLADALATVDPESKTSEEDARRDFDEHIKAAEKARKALSLFGIPQKFSGTLEEFQEILGLRSNNVFIRLIKSIAVHPNFVDNLLSNTIYGLHRAKQFTRLMDAETILNENIYRPQNLVAHLASPNKPQSSIQLLERFAELYGIAERRASTDSDSFVVPTSATFRQSNNMTQINSLGDTLKIPSLRGRYYVFARDLPNDVDTRNYWDVTDHEQPRLSATTFYTGTPWDSKWVKQQYENDTASQDIFHPLDTVDSAKSISQPIARCQLVRDKTNGMRRLRLEMYIYSHNIFVRPTERIAYAKTEKAFNELMTKVLNEEDMVVRLAQQIQGIPAGQKVPNDLFQKHKEAVAVLKTSITKAYAMINEMRVTTPTIYAVKVFETPPVFGLVKPPTTHEELTQYVARATARQQFYLTRALVRADHAILVGLEQFVSTIPVLVNKTIDGITPLYVGRLVTEETSTLLRDVDAYKIPFFKKILFEEQNELAVNLMRSTWQRFQEVFGTQSDWIGTDPSKFTSLEYQLLLRIVCDIVMRRCMLGENDKWELEVDIKLPDTDGGRQMTNVRDVALTATRDALDAIFSSAYISVGRDAAKRQIVNDALEWQPLDYELFEDIAIETAGEVASPTSASKKPKVDN